MVIMGNGCSAKPVGPGKQKNSRQVPASGVLKGMAPGTYTVKVKQKNCKPKPSKVTVQKGKRTTAEVLSDPKLVATSPTGSFSGREADPNGTLLASWGGQVTFSLATVGTYSSALFPQLARYEVTAASGSWTISGPCARGSGSLTLGDIDVTNSSLWMNPWDNNRYAIYLKGDVDKAWPYVHTCDPVRNANYQVPVYMLVSNKWSGIDPVDPPFGANPSGTFTWDNRQGTGSTTWTWDLGQNASKEYGKP